MSKTILLNEDNIDLSSIQNDQKNEIEEPEPHVEIPPVGDLRNILSLRQRIINYREALGLKLTNYNLSNEYLESLNENDLTELLQKIQFTIGVRNTGQFWHQTFLHGMSLTEHIGVSFGLKLQGLTNSLYNDQILKDLITEVTLKHDKASYIEPEYRLLLHVSSKAYQLHVTNSITENLANQMKIINETAHVLPEIIEKYKDL
jgi:hypothetical protein